jgi:hypothetical protein
VTSRFVVDATRGAWLTLALMMLLSRVAFQAAGPDRMRAFLDGWQRGWVKRVWGGVTLVFALFIAAAGFAADGRFRVFDLVLLAALVAVLVLDGAVNVLPAGFETFKERLQGAWVRRARSGWEDDSHLFGIVNALLAAGAVTVGVVVLAYRPVHAPPVVAAVAAAVALTAALIAGSVLTTRRL